MQTAQQRKSQKKLQQGRNEEQQRLLDEYFDTIAQLRSVRSAFEHVTDPDLISACVYEINALQTRYSYLLNRIREENLTFLQILR